LLFCVWSFLLLPATRTFIIPSTGTETTAAAGRSIATGANETAQTHCQTEKQHSQEQYGKYQTGQISTSYHDSSPPFAPIDGAKQERIQMIIINFGVLFR
jgi:hypothetical protein